MIGIFKQKNPGNALVLLIYALILKSPVFLHPVQPLLHPEDNYLYRAILQGLNSLFRGSAILYSLLTFLLLFTQATLFNRVCNHHKLFPRPNFLPGMSYVLVTSLLPDWNHFSAPLLINSIMIWMLHRMISLYNNPRAIGAIFNIGFLTGVVTLLYIPGIAFLLLMFFALILMRPFRLREWVIGIVGFTSPYYFLLLILFFTNQLNWRNIVPHITLTLPGMPSSIWITLGIILLIVPFTIGGYFVQLNLTKMLIQVRKSWSLLLSFLMVAVIVILINKANSYENWIVTAVPFSAFHASAYYYSSDKRLPLILHWLCFILIIIVGYFINYR